MDYAEFNALIRGLRSFSREREIPAPESGLLAGSGSANGIGKFARFNCPSGIAVDSAGNIYVADTLKQHDPQSDTGRNELGGDDARRNVWLLRHR